MYTIARLQTSAVSGTSPKRIHLMENIYKESQDAVEKGVPFRIDIKSRSFVLGKQTVIDHGSFEGAPGIPKCSQEEALEALDSLYADYRCSIPSERSDHTKPLFRALKEKDLPPDALLWAQKRETARLRLELRLLLDIILGNLRWGEGVLQGWFRQSTVNPDMIIFREWIES